MGTSLTLCPASGGLIIERWKSYSDVQVVKIRAAARWMKRPQKFPVRPAAKFVGSLRMRWIREEFLSVSYAAVVICLLEKISHSGWA